MATKTRAVDRGSDRARLALATLGRELRTARTERGLSQADVGRSVGVSGSYISRIERGLRLHESLWLLERLFAVVGMDLSVRSFPGGQPIRDAAQVALLDRFRRCLHRSIRWLAEAPLPIAGDQRAWDGLIVGQGWRYGVEAETSPRDAQALQRRLALKQRDGDVDGVLLILPATARSKQFLRAAGDSFSNSFPVPGGRALELLSVGMDPGGSSIVLC